MMIMSENDSCIRRSSSLIDEGDGCNIGDTKTEMITFGTFEQNPGRKMKCLKLRVEIKKMEMI